MSLRFLFVLMVSRSALHASDSSRSSASKYTVTPGNFYVAAGIQQVSRVMLWPGGQSKVKPV